MAPRTMADIMAENEAAALRDGPATYALLLACRRGTDRYDEADMAAWIEEGRQKAQAAALTEAGHGKAKRGPHG